MNIKELAKQAGFEVLETGNDVVLVSDSGTDALTRFTALVQAAEREACGEIANKKAADVLEKNTYRGRTSSAASFAAEMLEDVGATIRMRSNMEVSRNQQWPQNDE